MTSFRTPTARIGQTITVRLTGEQGVVTYVSPEGAVNVAFPDDTNCRLSPSEFR